MAHLVTIDLSDTARLIIDPLNWILQAKTANKETGELDWDDNTNRFYPNLEWFAQGLLKHNIETNVIKGMEVIEAIHQAEQEVKKAVGLISKRIGKSIGGPD